MPVYVNYEAVYMNTKYPQSYLAGQDKVLSLSLSYGHFTKFCGQIQFPKQYHICSKLNRFLFHGCIFDSELCHIMLKSYLPMHTGVFPKFIFWSSLLCCNLPIVYTTANRHSAISILCLKFLTCCVTPK